MKTHRINWTRQAREDLREIRKYIARDAPVTARLFVERLKLTARRLRDFPEAGSVVTEFGNPNVREIFHGAYRIIYRVGIEKIDILTVFHSARMLDSLKNVSAD
jgi:addiction module RelE/StbE family toxin